MKKNLTNLFFFYLAVETPLIFSVISDSEKTTYKNEFLIADLNHDGFIDGAEAKQYFSKFQLPTKTLAQIWFLFFFKKNFLKWNWICLLNWKSKKKKKKKEIIWYSCTWTIEFRGIYYCNASDSLCFEWNECSWKSSRRIKT